MSRFIDYAIGHARLTIATLVFLLVAGAVAYVTIPKEAEPDVRIPIIYRAALPARHQPGGFRAAAAAAGRNPAQVDQQRQGNALDRLRGRRLSCCSNSTPASTPRRRWPTCAPRSTTPNAICRAASTSRRFRRSICRSIRCWWSASPATCRSARCCGLRGSAKNTHRAGSRRAGGGAAWCARRGGRDHPRSHADAQLRHFLGYARPGDAVVQYADCGRRDRRRERPLLGEGAVAVRAARRTFSRSRWWRRKRRR